MESATNPIPERCWLHVIPKLFFWTVPKSDFLCRCRCTSPCPPRSYAAFQAHGRAPPSHGSPLDGKFLPCQTVHRPNACERDIRRSSCIIGGTLSLNVFLSMIWFQASATHRNQCFFRLRILLTVMFIAGIDGCCCVFTVNALTSNFFSGR